jgi:hypothetical protein
MYGQSCNRRRKQQRGPNREIEARITLGKRIDRKPDVARSIRDTDRILNSRSLAKDGGLAICENRKAEAAGSKRQIGIRRMDRKESEEREKKRGTAPQSRGTLGAFYSRSRGGGRAGLAPAESSPDTAASSSRWRAEIKS